MVKVVSVDREKQKQIDNYVAFLVCSILGHSNLGTAYTRPSVRLGHFMMIFKEMSVHGSLFISHYIKKTIANDEKAQIL